MHTGYAYGRWGLVVTMAVIVLFFLLRLVPMKTRLGKRSGSALIAFVTALFAEMYGFPLTIYLLGHFLGVRILLDHINGHLLGDLLTYAGLGNGWVIVMVVSNLLLVAGVWIISSGWDAVYHAQGGLVTSGVYSHVRHPQYSGIFLLTIGFMIQWPTLATLILWPFVIVMYRRLAKQEEKDALAEFGDEYRRYMATTPMFIPRIHRTRHAGAAAS